MSDSTREALAEIGERARGIVEELARHTRDRRSAPAGAATGFSSASQQAHSGTSRATESARFDEAVPAGLHQRLSELRACVGEVADVLEATVERLETVELQLGDPDASIERHLCDSIERCERVLHGIEHRVVLAAAPDAREQARPVERPCDLPTVLVVAESSRRRAHLCLALERQGLRSLAAASLALAVRVSARRSPSVALVELGDRHDLAAQLLEEWKEHEERGSLPCAAVLDAGGAAGTPAFGFETIKEQHGEAAMAATLTRLARR
jgi:exonuclease VII small subunit